jgi:hypothetical protein
LAKFTKGQSGNPGGRPKEDPELKELARAASPEAIERLVHWMRSDNAKASVTSCIAILDRAYGKPVQMTELTGKDGGPIETADLSEKEIARRIAFALSQGLAKS